MSTISERNESATTQYPFPLSTIKQLTRERNEAQAHADNAESERSGWQRTAIERTDQLAQSQARLEVAERRIEALEGVILEIFASAMQEPTESRSWSIAMNAIRANQPPAPITLCACGDDLSRHSENGVCRECECRFYSAVSANSPLLDEASSHAASEADFDALNQQFDSDMAAIDDDHAMYR